MTNKRLAFYAEQFLKHKIEDVKEDIEKYKADDNQRMQEILEGLLEDYIADLEEVREMLYQEN